MKICGIVCEYNPFHNGHYLHIQKTRELLGYDTAVICCMSGNYVQRGEPALLPKHLRAQAAVLSGADLVIELPSAYSLLSAEGFARSSVYIFDALDIVTDISFGAENSDTELLCDIAGLLREHSIVQQTLTELKTGISYAAARERALYSAIREKSAVISHPNNILGIEYIKAIYDLSSSITPHAIGRIGASHDSPEQTDGTWSASAIRRAICENPSDNLEMIRDYVPEASFEILKEAAKNGLCMNDRELFERQCFAHLLRLSAEDYACFPDVSEGLEHRIYNAVKSAGCCDDILSAAKTRRYPLSRLRRILLRAYLGITEEMSLAPPPYCRVLAFNQTGQQLLSKLRESSNIPVITKTAHISNLPDKAKTLFNIESLSTDLYNAALPAHSSFRAGYEWRVQPVRL